MLHIQAEVENFVGNFQVKHLSIMRPCDILCAEVRGTKTTRYSKTRMRGANHTACTKLTEEEKARLHAIAVERELSNYELTRRIIQEYIRNY